MSSATEAICNRKYVQDVFSRHGESDWGVVNVWADGTDEERMKAGEEEGRLREGLVCVVDETPRIKMRSAGASWPAVLTVEEGNAEVRDVGGVQDLQLLELRGVSGTCDSLILDLGTKWLQIKYLGRTSVQMYSEHQWYDSICKVSYEVRRFKVGMALEFKNGFVLAFLSSGDNSSQAVWNETRERLEQSCPTPADVYHDWDGFLKGIAKWMETRHATSDRSGLVFDCIRNARHIFPGVDAGTASELCFIAGISPFLTESEVFDSPSRTARLLEAYFTHIAYVEEEVWDGFVRTAIRQGLLAPTPEQRKNYANALYVFTKIKTSVPQRLANLVDQYNEAMQSEGGAEIKPKHCPVDDPFEPTYLRRSLERPNNLSHLIFGDVGEHLPPNMLNTLALSTKGVDPITALFRRRGTLHSKSYLACFIPPLFISGREFKRSWRRTYAFTEEETIWSLTLPPPTNTEKTNTSLVLQLLNVITSPMRWYKSPTRPTLTRIPDDELKKLTLAYVVDNTVHVLTGPLEHPINATVLKRNGSRARNVIISVCKSDPALAPYYAERELRGLARTEAGLNLLGKRKQALPPHMRVRHLRDAEERVEARDVARLLSGEAEEDEEERKRVKRRRLSADVWAVREAEARFGAGEEGKRKRRVSARAAGLEG